MTFVGRLTDFDIAYTGIFQYLLDFFLMLVAHLDNDTRVLGKQYLDEVLLFHLVEVDFHTAFYIGEAHFEQRSDKTAGRNVVSGKNKSLVD